MSASSDPFEIAAASVACPIDWQIGDAGGDPIADIGGAVIEALNHPIGFPPIGRAIVPGDVIAVPIHPEIPDAVEILPAVDGVLRDAGADRIEWVVPAGVDVDWMNRWSARLPPNPSLHVHRPDDRDHLAYLTADDEATPIYLARQLVQADVVLPIVPAAATTGSDPAGIYPTFADSAAMDRVRDGADVVDREGPAAPISEAAWHLGVQLVLSITPGLDGSTQGIEAGTPAELRKASASASGAGESPIADFVFASLDGGPAVQTWLRAIEAIRVAADHTRGGGTIVLWTDIDAPLADEKIESAIEQVAEDYRLLVRTIGDCRDSLEMAGAAVISTPAEVTRVSGVFAGGGVIRGAAQRSRKR